MDISNHDKVIFGFLLNNGRRGEKGSSREERYKREPHVGRKDLSVTPTIATATTSQK
jgi:hypothetical protein